ncbi:hypothetical protein Cop2CBH44_08750 [Coprobacter secundus subsp. similis]|uniref:type I site-specific deoxyribonuclease n=1 Tax=Coprobacter secundus subsp. similis TaxID=2751153 RepID=A0A7G1HUT1_9BACT|nr:hypothetical protein Cop2CBH44_08750 [Coprobacter secundus subsp. similis]
MTILINGLPLVQIELKRRGVELKQAYNQIQRYHKTSFHGLFDYIQLFVISNGVNTRYFANNPNSGYKFTFNWTDAANHPFNELNMFASFFLEKCTLGKIIGKYIVLHEGDKCLMVLRPYQFYAVEKILDKVKNSNDNGYIWHTTGAGKTLTSFKAAQLVSELDDVDKVMFVVDRHDLDTQTQSEYEAFEPGAVDGTDNTDELVKRLQSNSKIIITTGRDIEGLLTFGFPDGRTEIPQSPDDGIIHHQHGSGLLVCPGYTDDRFIYVSFQFLRSRNIAVRLFHIPTALLVLPYALLQQASARVLPRCSEVSDLFFRSPAICPVRHDRQTDACPA